MPVTASDVTSIQAIPPSHAIKAGESYTIEQLIEYMIKYSDNNAKQILLRMADPASLLEVTSDLGIPTPKAGEDYVISPKMYSLFFRVLYNATYLNRAFSERAVNLLLQADFADGLVAGVPIGTEVAHKFGEASTTIDTVTGFELHDCGVVYLPNHPYFLCVMTKGISVSDLEETIRSISQRTYSVVQSAF